MAQSSRIIRIPCAILLVLFCADGQALDNRAASSKKSACGQPATPISSVQGSAANSPVTGKKVDVEAVVVGQFQGPDGLGGLFLEEEQQDRDESAQSSEGLFIHTALTARGETSYVYVAPSPSSKA